MGQKFNFGGGFLLAQPQLGGQNARMALYHNAHDMTQSNDPAFLKDHPPGNAAPLAGIYRNLGTGVEEYFTVTTRLPEHPPGNTAKWKLIVALA